MKPGTSALLALLTAAAPPVAGAVFEFSGTARHEGKVLYEEDHRVEGTCSEGVFAPVDHQVSYRNPESGDEFASKSLYYNSSAFRPQVEFRQPRFGEALIITYAQDQTLDIVWRAPAGGTREFTVPFDQRLVVDSGFDYFVRANWEQVQQGESVEFRFLAPTRGEHYGFVLEPATSVKVNAEVTVQIRPTSLVLRFLVDPIVLGYSSDGALTDYLGLTNIRQDAESNHIAHIRYQVSRLPDCELTR
ncbi:hypothetical protein JF541_03510 [Marinobacter hydrocarbonoclasticus]|uniref:hypothetical protein n=1 Tax=Marinobacter nauticus TaxID=2743 RepID=UPI001A8F0A66|nr:hypothetical protein [Marinobacter nauticus]MBN8238196.1 hypothetical protein [Marinobacter nauticus]